MVLIAGLPMHWALTWQQRTRVRDYAIAGALLGAVPVIGYVIVAVAFEAKFAVSAMSRAFSRNRTSSSCWPAGPIACWPVTVSPSGFR